MTTPGGLNGGRRSAGRPWVAFLTGTRRRKLTSALAGVVALALLGGVAVRVHADRVRDAKFVVAMHAGFPDMPAHDILLLGHGACTGIDNGLSATESIQAVESLGYDTEAATALVILGAGTFCPENKKVAWSAEFKAIAKPATPPAPAAPEAGDWSEVYPDPAAVELTQLRARERKQRTALNRTYKVGPDTFSLSPNDLMFGGDTAPEGTLFFDIDRETDRTDTDSHRVRIDLLVGGKPKASTTLCYTDGDFPGSIFFEQPHGPIPWDAIRVAADPKGEGCKL
jgi:hypothetical protein